MVSDDDYFHNGLEKASTINLYTGWNLVGYPNTNASSINDSLNELSYTKVMTYDTLGNIMLVYSPSGSSNTLNELNAYKSYWINSTSNQSWNIIP